MVEEGRFRQDLFYRLCTHQANIPPLASRKGDIQLLLERFVTEAATAMHKDVPVISEELPCYLSAYDFPGNIRELKAMVYDAVALHSRGVLAKDCFIKAIDLRRPVNSIPAASETTRSIVDFGDSPPHPQGGGGVSHPEGHGARQW